MSGPDAMPEALQQPDQLISALFGSPGIGIAICDNRLRFNAINQALAVMNGVPLEAHLGKTIHQVLGPLADRLNPVIEKVLQTGEPISNFEVIGKLRTRTESSRWIENFFPIRDGHGKVEKVGVVIIEATRPLFASADDKWLRQADAQWAYQEQCPLPANTVPELFRNLDKTSIDVLLRVGRRCTRYRGEVFCRQGELATHVYLLLNGLVKVGGVTDEGHEVLLDWMRPGEVFGLRALLSPPAENLWAVASVANTEALEWDTALISRFAESCPKFHENALRIALRWVHHLQVRFEALSTKTVEQRLADTVVFLAARFRGNGQPEVPLSDLELAQMTGTNLYTVNKIIHNWQRLGYVNKSRRRLIILDCTSLRRVSRS
ncbi:MAG: PAS domain-containing protein [Candidatus Angelobacter sp.]